MKPIVKVITLIGENLHVKFYKLTCIFCYFFSDKWSIDTSRAIDCITQFGRSRVGQIGCSGYKSLFQRKEYLYPRSFGNCFVKTTGTAKYSNFIHENCSSIFIDVSGYDSICDQYSSTFD